MRAIIILGLFSSLLIGCCGLTQSSSSTSLSCPYGTYGSACTNICSKLGNRDNCFTTCMDSVRSEGLGDATTCCKQTFNQQCTQQCKDLETRTHGDTTAAECMEECNAAHDAIGINMNSCALPV